MKNKLLNRYLLPSYIASVFFVGMAGTTTFFAKKEAQMVNNNLKNKTVADSCRTAFFLCLLIATASVIMSVFCGVKYPQIVREKTKTMTRHYLQDIFVRYPETRQYHCILEESAKLYEIAAVVCNNLTKEERKEILNLVNKESDKSASLDSTLKLRKTESIIMDIIQKHAEKDPEYINKILLAIANAQKPDVVKTEQKVR